MRLTQKSGCDWSSLSALHAIYSQLHVTFELNDGSEPLCARQAEQEAAEISAKRKSGKRNLGEEKISAKRNLVRSQRVEKVEGDSLRGNKRTLTSPRKEPGWCLHWSQILTCCYTLLLTLSLPRQV